MRGRRSGTTLYRVERPGDGKVGQTPTGASDPRPGAILAPRAAVAQLARASACHAEGRGFESHQPLARTPLCERFFRTVRSLVRLILSRTLDSEWTVIPRQRRW